MVAPITCECHQTKFICFALHQSHLPDKNKILIRDHDCDGSNCTCTSNIERCDDVKYHGTVADENINEMSSKLRKFSNEENNI